MRPLPHVLLAGAAALAGSVPVSAGERPAATCSQPAPRVASSVAPPHCVLAPAVESADVPESLEVIYRAWARATADLEPLTALDRRRVECAAGKDCTAHELAILCQFHGPVHADDLRSRYQCSRIEKRGRSVRLTLAPADPVDRLFVPACVVTLETTTHRPTSIEFPATAARKTACRLPIVARENIDHLIAQSDAPPEACGVPGPPVPIEMALLIPGVEETPRAVRPVTPEVARVLAQWEQATTGKSLQAQVRRFTYDLIFHTERRSSGRFRYEPSGAGRLELHSQPVDAAVDPARRTADGQPYQLVADQSELWVGREPALLPVPDDADALPVAGAIRQADGTLPPSPADGDVRPASAEAAAPLPPGRFPHEILPLVVDVRAEQLSRDFAIECVHETPDQVWLRFEPQNQAARFRELSVILDKHTWLPVATRCLDAAGSTEVVHTFRHWKATHATPSDALPLVPPAPAPPHDETE